MTKKEILNRLIELGHFPTDECENRPDCQMFYTINGVHTDQYQKFRHRMLDLVWELAQELEQIDLLENEFPNLFTE